MNRSRNLHVTLFLFLFFLGCNESSDKADSAGPQSKQAILMDSLQKLDSIVLKHKAKNATESIKYAKQAGKLVQELNTPAARAKAYIILGNAYSVTNVDSGFYFYQQAMIVINSFNLTDKRGIVLYNLGMLSRSIGDFKNYIILIDSARRFSTSVNDYITMSNSLNSFGNFYFSIGEKLSARKMYDSAFSVASRKLLYLQMGSALGNLAKFETDAKKSIALSRQAISYLERGIGSAEPIAMCLVNIGNHVSDADSAIHYYTQAINMVSVEFAPEVIMGSYNNMAYCYLWKGDMTNAEKCMIEHALPVAIKTNNIDWQSTVYDTYSDVLERKGNSADAMIYKKKAKKAKEDWSTITKQVHYLNW